MRLALPGARFIGMSTFDCAKYRLPDDVKIDMQATDIARAKEMLAYPWFADKKWQREIHAMIESGFKMEIEALSKKGISFITEEYIPKKLRDKDWLQ
jgi:DNA topoisomerase-6 subunit A